jgi:flagellar protein FliO/FliZ
MSKIRWWALAFYFVATEVCATPEMNLPTAAISRGEVMRVLMGLFLVIVVLILLSWLLKRLNIAQIGSSKGFETIATMALSTKEKMVLLKVGRRYLLIGIGAASVNTLYDFGEQLPEGFGAETTASFTEVLKSMVRKS